MYRNMILSAMILFAAVALSQAQVSSGAATCSFTFFKVLQGSVPGIGGINDLDYVSGTVQIYKYLRGFERKPDGTIFTFKINGQSNQASKINNAGAIVGSYYPSATRLDGYQRNPNGTFTPISDPLGANGTAAYGINNAGEIVGYYNTSSGAQFGFTEMNGKFSSFSHPGWSFMQPEGVNKQGVVVGSYLDSHSIMHGFVYANGSFASLNFPGASNTAALGINDAGEIVGWYLPTGASYSEGFIYSGGKFSTMVVNGKPSISVDGVNNLGHIYGDAYGTSFIGKNCH